MSRWFVMQNDIVKGPYSRNEIKAQVASGHVDPHCLVWGRTQSGWQKISQWMKEPEKTNVTAITQDISSPSQQWHYAIDGVSKGPFARAELIQEIKNQKHGGEILVWTKGMKAWVDLYEFHDLVEELGLDRRAHQRAPVTGSVTMISGELTLLGQMKTISPGGFGAVQISAQLTVGTPVAVEIKASSVGTGAPISAKAVVQYVSETGFYGFKFTSLDMESKSHILDYIRSHTSESRAA